MFNSFKDTFDQLKRNGLFRQYKTYEDYCQAKYPDLKEKTEYEKWKEGLPEKDQKDFETVFGEDGTRE
jgi:hypothetical protein